MATKTDTSNSQLLFVYNADSGFMNMLKDWTHKIVSPSTYDCQLCTLTYGNGGMRKKWQTFIANLPFDTLFLHRDEFHQQYPHLKDVLLPCIFIKHKHNELVEVWLSAEAINREQTLDGLIDACTRSVQSTTKS